VAADGALDERRLKGIESNVIGLFNALRELVAQQALLVLTLRDPGTIELPEIDQALKSLNEIDATLVRIGEFLPDIGESGVG